MDKHFWENEFNRIDRDKKNSINLFEFREIMQHRTLPANEFEIIGLFKKADIDRSGTLSLEEMIRIIQTS